jgi:hypothetical protein
MSYTLNRDRRSGMVIKLPVQSVPIIIKVVSSDPSDGNRVLDT